MSFGVADLALQAIIQDGLAHLRQHPHHLEFILGSYCEIPYVAKRVGKDFIKNAMEMLQKNALVVRPFFTLDQDQYPCVVIATSYDEDQQFLGDLGDFITLGDSGLQGDFTVPATIYAKFDATRVKDDEITVDNAYELEKKIFLGLWVTNGKVSAKIKGIKPGTANLTLHLDRKIAGNPALKGWKAQNLARSEHATVNASHNAVTAQINLFTSGDPDLHRIYAQVIRYCLKRGRKQLEEWGLQNTSFSQRPPTVAIDEGPVLSSSFGMQAVQLDRWIADDWINPDSLDITVVAASTKPGNEDVTLVTEADPNVP